MMAGVVAAILWPRGEGPENQRLAFTLVRSFIIIQRWLPLEFLINEKSKSLLSHNSEVFCYLQAKIISYHYTSCVVTDRSMWVNKIVSFVWAVSYPGSDFIITTLLRVWMSRLQFPHLVDKKLWDSKGRSDLPSITQLCAETWDSEQQLGLPNS